MDKKKVKELIEQILKYCDQAYNPNWQPKSFEEFIKLGNICREAINELSKSDWVSVEDELPDYSDENIVVWEDYDEIIEPIYLAKQRGANFTYWRKIDKLEVT